SKHTSSSSSKHSSSKHSSSKHTSSSSSKHSSSKDSTSKHSSSKDSTSKHTSSSSSKHGSSKDHDKKRSNSSTHHKSSSKDKHSKSDSKHKDSYRESKKNHLLNMGSESDADFMDSDSNSALLLCGAKKRKADLTKLDVPPPPTKQVKLSSSDIFGTLPEISPNYKPLPYLPMGIPSKNNESIPVDIGKKSHSRTQVYSGRKQNLTEVPSLFDACMRVVMDNIDDIDGFPTYIPYDVIKPVLQKCNPSQLYNIEDCNPYLIEDTEQLWKLHAERDFRNKEPNKDDCESYREMYLKLHDERDARLKTLTSSISRTAQKSQKDVRKAKLAYVDTFVKPPREVLRNQKRYGTAGPVATDPLSRLSSHGGQKSKPGRSVGQHRNREMEQNLGASLRRNKEAKRVAPMMQKTLQLMKRLKR
ncbi:unnamed protein product, partial [Owenia fusiformis]